MITSVLPRASRTSRFREVLNHRSPDMKWNSGRPESIYTANCLMIDTRRYQAQSISKSYRAVHNAYRQESEVKFRPARAFHCMPPRLNLLPYLFQIRALISASMNTGDDGISPAKAAGWRWSDVRGGVWPSELLDDRCWRADVVIAPGQRSAYEIACASPPSRRHELASSLCHAFTYFHEACQAMAIMPNTSLDT